MSLPNNELDSCKKPAEEASGIPPYYYAEEAAVALEIANIFRNGWIGLGRADVVKNPGDFVTLDLAGQNIISLRDQMRGDLADAVKKATDREGFEQFHLQRTQDHKEGLKAVAERRIGNFTGS